jgi:uncharacterized protein
VELQQRLEGDLKDAMRSRDRVRADAIRMLMTELKNEMVSGKGRRDLSAEESDRVTARIVKRHRDSIDQFEKAGRDDLAQHERSQLAVVEAYLPELMARDEVEPIVRATIVEVGATNPKQQGAVMAALNPKLRGKADMRMVSEIVRTALTASAADAR